MKKRLTLLMLAMAAALGGWAQTTQTVQGYPIEPVPFTAVRVTDNFWQQRLQASRDGNVYVNHRLFLLHGESKYYDVLERTLYNGLLAGVSLDGGSFFYPNPLESADGYERQPWFGCACCPSDICRFIPSLPGYVYAVKGQDVYVNLYVAGTAEIGGRASLPDQDTQGTDMVGQGCPTSLTITQETNYPWEGQVTLTITPGTERKFALRLRIPGWVRGEVVPRG